jgi:hypothetical protein
MGKRSYVDPFHPRERRTSAQGRRKSFNRVPLPLAFTTDRSIGFIAYPAPDIQPQGVLISPGAKTNALDSAENTQTPILYFPGGAAAREIFLSVHGVSSLFGGLKLGRKGRNYVHQLVIV